MSKQKMEVRFAFNMKNRPEMTHPISLIHRSYYVDQCIFYKYVDIVQFWGTKIQNFSVLGF